MFRVNGITWSAIFGDGFLPLSITFSRVVHVVGGVSGSFLFMIVLCGYTTAYSFDH